MHKIYLSNNNIVTSLGFDSNTVVNAIENDESGISLIDDENVFLKAFYGSMIDLELLDESFEKISKNDNFTRLEKMMISSLNDVIKSSKLNLDSSVGLIVSTTKGNINVLESNSKFPKERAYLSELGNTIQQFFQFENEAIVVSNACVSGLLAISVAKRYIKEGVYKHVFIVSGDIISEFILSGFNSFHAMSDSPCQPYSSNRTGINLGEAAASVLVTSDDTILVKESVELIGEASCNDANHISGPSRTGEGLYRSVQNAIKESNLKIDAIDYISAHGTATNFNDEMEAIAFNRSGLEQIPMNSLKGYLGHTMGASGLLETIVGMHSLNRNILFASKGFDTLGVSKPINIIQKTTNQNLNIFLKTASGFGGCNTAAIFKKVNS